MPGRKSWARQRNWWHLWEKEKGKKKIRGEKKEKRRGQTHAHTNCSVACERGIGAERKSEKQHCEHQGQWRREESCFRQQSRHFPAAHGGPLAKPVGILWGKLQPGEGERPSRSRLCSRNCWLWSRLIPKDWSPWRRPTLQQFTKDRSPWEGPALEQGTSTRMKRGRGELMWTYHNPCFPSSLSCPWGDRFGNEGFKLILGKSGWDGGKVF